MKYINDTYSDTKNWTNSDPVPSRSRKTTVAPGLKRPQNLGRASQHSSSPPGLRHQENLPSVNGGWTDGGWTVDGFENLGNYEQLTPVVLCLKEEYQEYQVSRAGIF